MNWQDGFRGAWRIDHTHWKDNDGKEHDETITTIKPSKSGAIGGVAAGAALGSAVPIIGTTAGAVVGGIVGFIFGPAD